MPWFCASEHQGGRLPSNKDQALPWWLVSVPRSTRKANYHLKCTKHYRGGLFLCQGVPGRPVTIQKYQALPWWSVSVSMSNRKIGYHTKNTKHYRDGLFLCQGVPGRPITIRKIPSITVMACFCAKEYQEGRLPPKKYQASPWCLVSVPRSTRKAD